MVLISRSRILLTLSGTFGDILSIGRANTINLGLPLSGGIVGDSRFGVSNVIHPVHIQTPDQPHSSRLVQMIPPFPVVVQARVLGFDDMKVALFTMVPHILYLCSYGF